MKKDYSRKQQKFAENIATKEIDLLVKDEEVEIVEAKREFESRQVEEALGQLLIYKELYLLDHPSDKVNLTTIFPESSFGNLLGDQRQMVGGLEAIESLLGILENYGIDTLFMDEDGQFKRFQHNFER